MIVNSITEDYRNHFSAKIKSLDTSNHNLFNEIQQISAYKRRENLPNIMLSNDESETYTNNKTKANGFAKQFASVNEINIDEDEYEAEFYNAVEDGIDEWYQGSMNDSVFIFSNVIKANNPYENCPIN